ncbi:MULTISPECIES: LysE family transporter [unclassified Flavobacterium]|jgi:threonine/homoserine/homoserine lactone efflux protein|uniref:LysE family transporter n=1 Tax=unclassified Flavobacterium TaxID=196869 RepID=UPI00070D4685|nr:MULTISPECIES: LysE family transporter [unclassified Flavobacterium]KRD63146.1 lysine transporter LysE [Flavobacterium sp. Root935]MDQ1163879.1 threonine/homoserine/homoserine lactone efflux protein [Flavobacterium sp. SORGH_AS_0622]TDX13800.1 threonine/homoserine/homoserine lactone efflux protein [Flavobacterium sp. S87F.05.LMB.W.Kidney.N]BDU24448.1 lysine transporter LysE [Flavobacterium sp. GSB-24]
MVYLTPLLSGFIAAAIGIIPPGLINMTAAKINLKEGKKNAFWFVIGAVLVIFFQVYVAVLFARVIDNRPDVVTLLREVGFVIFSILTIYFLFIAKDPITKKKSKIKKSSKKSRFFLGMLLSSLNFFPIPYYVVVSVTLASYHLFVFENNIIFTFVLGSVIGSFAVLYSYIAFFGRIEKKTDYLMRNMNTIIGSITGLVAIVTLFNILNYYFG